jgi:hypothetical protein
VYKCNLTVPAVARAGEPSHSPAGRGCGNFPGYCSKTPLALNVLPRMEVGRLDALSSDKMRLPG